MILKSKTKTHLISLSVSLIISLLSPYLSLIFPLPPSPSLSLSLSCFHTSHLSPGCVFSFLDATPVSVLPSPLSPSLTPSSPLSVLLPPLPSHFLLPHPPFLPLSFLTSIFLYPPPPPHILPVHPFLSTLFFLPPSLNFRLSVSCCLSISLLCAFILYIYAAHITEVEIICILDFFSDEWVTHRLLVPVPTLQVG